MAVSYKDAGVDLDLYEQAMGKLPSLMQRTFTPRVMRLNDGFAGLFRLGSSKKFARNYRYPVLVSGTDGVGTKIKVAIASKQYDTVGIDLVGMCVNDCLCLGAEPLFFLDYLALGKDDPELIGQLVAGVANGCEQTGMALIGGETAIMPDMYSAGDFDMAGFCVGVVERKQLIDGSDIAPGDVLIGLASSGFHSNGFSLIRKVVKDAKLKYDKQVPELGTTLGAALLEPTRLYVKCVQDVLSHCKPKTTVHGLAHITGGGLADNIVRILPDNVRVEIDRSTWQRPALFDFIQQHGEIDADEMYRVFNMGIGFVLILKPKAVDKALHAICRHHIAASVIGRVVEGEKAVVLT